MKQLSAVQGLMEGASRIMLRRHLETCVAKAMAEGRRLRSPSPSRDDDRSAGSVRTRIDGERSG